MKLFILVFFLSLFAMGVVVMRIEINRSGREISRLQAEVEVKEARNQYLQLEISRLSSPANIHKAAQNQLGLQTTKPQQIVTLNKI